VQAIPREAKHFELGEARYYTVLAWSAVLWQFFFLGAVGVIFCVHTLLAGILIAVFIPVTEVAAVIFLHEKFSSEKGVALVLSLGPRVLLLRRVERGQGQEEDARGRRGGPGPVRVACFATVDDGDARGSVDLFQLYSLCVLCGLWPCRWMESRESSPPATVGWSAFLSPVELGDAWVNGSTLLHGAWRCHSSTVPYTKV